MEVEGRRARAGRYSRWTALDVWAAVLVVVAVLRVIVQSTRHVRVGWVFGHSTVSLVDLVVVAAILGTSIVFRRRTPRH